MIALLPGELRALFPRLMDEMYDLRLGAARAHAGRPSAAVHRLAVVDYFDSLDPLYVLALDEMEGVAGALRVLPTTGVTMLNDGFRGSGAGWSAHRKPADLGSESFDAPRRRKFSRDGGRHRSHDRSARRRAECDRPNRGADACDRRFRQRRCIDCCRIAAAPAKH